MTAWCVPSRFIRPTLVEHDKCVEVNASVEIEVEACGGGLGFVVFEGNPLTGQEGNELARGGWRGVAIVSMTDWHPRPFAGNLPVRRSARCRRRRHRRGSRPLVVKAMIKVTGEAGSPLGSVLF